MTEEVIIKVGTTGDGSVDTLNKKLVDTGKNANKAESEISKLRKELRDAKGDMLKYAEGTEQYNRALRRASDIQGRMKETNDIVKAGVRDLGATTKLVAGTIGGLASGFQVAQGAMALFGVENDAVLETMMKMQAVMSITQGIAGFANGFDDLQDLMTGFRANADKSTQAVGELSKVSGEAATNMGNLAKEGAVIGSNLAGVDRMKDSIDGLSKSIESSSPKIEGMRNNLKFYEYQSLLLEKTQGANKSNIETLRKMAEAQRAGIKAEEDMIAQKKLLTEAQLKQNESNAKASGGLKSQILTMGAWIVVIAAATYALSWLIDKMNEVPESIKVKIEVDTDVFKQLSKDQIKIKTFLNDYNKAIKDVNKDRIAELEKYAKKEFDLTDVSLSKYKTSNIEKLQSSKELFKEYLKIAEDTYWNESIIKRKVEAQQAGQASLGKAQKLYAYQKTKKGSAFMGDAGFKWETYVKMAYDGSFTESVGEALLLTGVDQQIVDELRAVSIQNAIIKGLPKMRDIDLGTGKEKPTGGTKQSVNKLDTTLDKFQTPDLTVIDDFYEPILDAEIKYTNEELVIMEDNLKKRSVIYDDSIEDQHAYVVARESARREDINNELTNLYGKKAIIEQEAERFNDRKATYEQDILEINDYARNKANYQNLIILADKELATLGDKATQSDVDRINAKKKLYQDEIDLIDADIKAKNTQIESLKAQLKEADGYPEKMQQITDEIANLNISITESLRTSTDSERVLWDARIGMAKEYLDALSNLAGGFADIAQGNMDLTNAEYDQKIWANDEMVQSDEQREAKAYEIEMQRWQALQKNFEMQKKMKEAQAWMDFASGSVGIWTAPGITSLAPYGYILAGIQQAALLATTIGNIKTIKSQQMLKPHKGNGGSSGGASSANIALNPAKDALTSRDENLNTMAKANQKDAPTNVVKVSEINDVQSRVKVREENASY